MGAALRAEEGMLAIQMLIPIIDFFNEWSGRLDDSYGEGGMFVSDWGEKLDEAISYYCRRMNNLMRMILT